MNTLTKANNDQRSIMRPWLRDFFDVENLFDGGSLVRPFGRAASVPAVNVSENDKTFMVEVAAPGFKKDDFKVSIDDDMLTISAETKNEAKEDDKEYSRREYNYNSFTRSFSLPDNAKDDNIGANYSDGVLKLTIPKNEAKAKSARNHPNKINLRGMAAQFLIRSKQQSVYLHHYKTNQMIFQYPQTSKAVEVLNDLVKINNDRIAGYQSALNQSTNIDPELQEAFNKIVYEGICYKQQLIQKINQLDGDVKSGVNILGKIYRAWMDLKVAFAISTQKAIIASCLYNEEIALHAYRAALSENSGMTGDMYVLIMEQEEELKKNFEMIRNYRDVRHSINYSLVYFN